MLEKSLIALDGSPWHKEYVDLFVLWLLPVVSLVDDSIHSVQVWSDNEDDCLMLRLVDLLSRKSELLLDLEALRQAAHDEGEDLKQ